MYVIQNYEEKFKFHKKAINSNLKARLGFKALIQCPKNWYYMCIIHTYIQIYQIWGL